jgi:hypothetical protein
MARTTMAQRRRRPESDSAVSPTDVSPTPHTPVTLKWTLRRDEPVADELFGSLELGAGDLLVTLENHPHAIPAGCYLVSLTPSDRAKRGLLWAPSADYRLPQLEAVPGRSGIRIHALNHVTETTGCIGVGEQLSWRGPSADLRTLVASRDALLRLVNLLRQAEAAGDRVELDVLDAVPMWDGATERRVSERRGVDRRAGDRREG